VDKKRIFAPKEFKLKEEVDKITGIYAPFWLFDCKADGFISGEATRVHSWRQGNYKYTQTKYYSILRRDTPAIREFLWMHPKNWTINICI